MNSVKRFFREISQYPSAVVGLVIILFLIGVAVYTIIAIPYTEAVRLWRGGEEVWREYPKQAKPVWADWFSSDKLARTIVLSTQEGTATKEAELLPGTGTTDMTITFDIDFPYDGFPQELVLYFTARYQEKQPSISMTWVTPDGREIRTSQISSRRSQAYRFALDERLGRRLGGLPPTQGLFVDPSSEVIDRPIKGTYQLRVNALLFEENADLDAQLVIYGQVYGWAGTDHLRRDLMVAMLWGTPLALSFGLLAALGTSVLTMIIAAAGVWFGGVVDDLIQRITEVNLVLPVLPILIMVGTFYSKSIWVMLGLIIVLSIFGTAIKSYRAIFLQVKEAPYIEAARSYGAGNTRIIFLYLIPRIIPILIPGLVIGIPSFVFLEAALAVLGLGDPVLPTWGKVINDANTHGALYNQNYYWILEPAGLLIVTGLAFSMLGYALDRIFNPRLRGI
jgi:peptide/nickel transport system permease protein